MTRVAAVLAGAILLLPAAARAQDDGLAETIEEVRREIEEVRADLTARRGKIADERIALGRRVDEVSDEVRRLREEWRRKAMLRDEFGAEIEKMSRKADLAEDRVATSRSLLIEVRRNAGAQLSIVDAAASADDLAELDRRIDAAKDREQLPAAAEKVLGFLAAHAEAAAGVRRSRGAAVAPDGRELEGTFVSIGDALSLFAAEGSGGAAGIVTLLHGSPRPHVFSEVGPAGREGIRAAARGEEAEVPLDVTGGTALRRREARQTLAEQFVAGGVVMYPILGIAALGLLVGALKLWHLFRIRTDFDARFDGLAAVLDGKGAAQAAAFAREAPPPVRRLLEAAAGHAAEPRASLEEVLNEAILAETPRLGSRLSVLAVGAAVAPLLGLLGTVTGMIHTFRLISVFGTGDPRLLSAGISEALITTESGLVVAIPLLLLHAILSRRVRRIEEGLEASAISYLNRRADAGGDS